jgi:demethylmenaquinone methyltransferase/2-methoxy-6-polyprenyl-1,4-benzoquinol methylase
MLEIIRSKWGEGLQLVQADVFKWSPDQSYDLAFAAFWISHVPRLALLPFLRAMRTVVAPGGVLTLIDQVAPSEEEARATKGELQHRQLENGEMFQIVKIYYSIEELCQAASKAGFCDVSAAVAKYFFQLDIRA